MWNDRDDNIRAEISMRHILPDVGYPRLNFPDSVWYNQDDLSYGPLAFQLTGQILEGAKGAAILLGCGERAQGF